MDHHSEATDPLQHCGGYPVRHRRGLRGLRDIGEFSLRFGDFITLASALWLSFHVLYTAKYAPGRSMMLLTVIQFIVAGLLGSSPAYHRAHA